ncbi:DUF3558 domain-containing protein [Saccharomonospora glauca]|nr:DUF3558 domain-containing protein [Saccharomonospora glauca]
MVSKSYKRTGLVASLLLFAAVSACSEGERGIAEPQQSSVSVSGEASEAASTSSGPASLSIDPCELLTADDLAEVGEFEKEYMEGGGARSCRWQETFESGGNGFTFGLSVRDAQGIDTVKDIGNGLKQDEVNQRPTVSTQDPMSGDCTLALKLSDSSRVDVTVLGEGGCEIAEVIAGMVEPRLPELP